MTTPRTLCAARLAGARGSSARIAQMRMLDRCMKNLAVTATSMYTKSRPVHPVRRITPASHPMTHRGSLSILLGVCSVASASRGSGAIQAQRVQSAVVRGIVFDSLHGRPLANAFVTIVGRTGSSATDSRGRFRFDSLSPGVYTVTAQHPVLDSIGLSGLTAKATAEDGGGDVRLAIPSFETLWRVSCRGRVPRDSGIVFGSVRLAAGGAPVAGADIELSWADLALGKAHNVIQRQWRIETRTNEQGGYAVCGVPPRMGVAVLARTDSNASGRIDVAPIGIRVQRRDLLIGPGSGTSISRGTITGL